MDNLLLILISSWNEGCCYTADDSRAVELAIAAIIQKRLEGKVDFDSQPTMVEMETQLRKLIG